MATLGEAIDLVLSELTRSDASITSAVQREILKAVEFYAPKTFWFNEARMSFTASSTIYYPLASATIPILEIDQASVVVNGSVIELQRRSHAELQRIDISGFTGYPSHFAIFGEQIRLYPMPAAGTTYQVDVDGTRRVSTLSATTDTNEFLDEGLNLISARVQKRLYALRFKDADRAQICQISENEELARLAERTERLLSSGRLASND